MYFVTPLNGKFAVLASAEQAKPVLIDTFDTVEKARSEADALNQRVGESYAHSETPTDMMTLLKALA